MAFRCVLPGAVLVLMWACSSDPAEPEPAPSTPFTSEITFVVSPLPPEVIKVDVAVNGREMEPLNGTFDPTLTDRVTLRVPAGDSINAFARAFHDINTIQYIGETYFDVTNPMPKQVPIRLEFKGAHWP